MADVFFHLRVAHRGEVWRKTTQLARFSARTGGWNKTSSGFHRQLETRTPRVGTRVAEGDRQLGGLAMNTHVVIVFATAFVSASSHAFAAEASSMQDVPATARVQHAPAADEAPGAPAAGPQTAEAPHSTTPADAMPYHLSAEPAVLLPTGNLTSLTGPGIGGMLRLDYRFSDAWRFTGRAGYIAGSSTSVSVGSVSLTSGLGFAPVLGGAKLHVVGNDWAHVYAVGEVGIVWVNESTDVSVAGSSMGGSGTSTYACAALSGELEIDPIDLRVGLFAADVVHAQTSAAMLASLGFHFASF
jgi:hypothetical protein